MEKVKIQHGDLILYEVSEIPKTAVRKEINSNVFTVERGEGVNTHDITDTSGLEVYEGNKTLYLKVSKEIPLVHTEHGTQVLVPNKIYKKVNEREWDYETEEARKTQD